MLPWSCAENYIFLFLYIAYWYQNNHVLQNVHVNANSLKELLNAKLGAKPVSGISLNESNGFDCVILYGLAYLV